MTKHPAKLLTTLLGLALMLASCDFAKRPQTEVPIESTTDGSAFPKPTGYVSDFDNILTDIEENELTAIMDEHESNTTNQIAVVTLTSLEPYENIEDYSLALANHWGVGQKDKNNGVLIAIANHLKAIRIQIGTGIETRLTDEETKEIIDQVIIPRFKDNNYFLGLKDGIEAIIAELE